MLASLADLRRLLELPSDADQVQVQAALAGAPTDEQAAHEAWMLRFHPRLAVARGYHDHTVIARAGGEPEPSLREVALRSPARVLGY